MSLHVSNRACFKHQAHHSTSRSGLLSHTAQTQNMRHRLLLLLSYTVSVVKPFSFESVFSSPSGKLTYSPELVIPEPQDPTAILLLSNSIQLLSQRIRSAQANAAFIEGSINALRTFCNEQETAAGCFPGPVPVVYCKGKSKANFRDIRDAGAKGVLIPVAWTSNDERTLLDGEFVDSCNAAAETGLGVIPEICVSADLDIDIDTLVRLVEDALKEKPSALVFSYDETNEQKAEGDTTVTKPVNLATVSNDIPKRFPILCSVRAEAGEDRLSEAADRVKQAGYTGVFLRSECLPGFRLQLDMEILSKFWQACISDLKSTRSKSFGFRAKNNMDVSVATKWGNYQQSVLESGALGDPEDSYSIVDSASGEYKGFA